MIATQTGTCACGVLVTRESAGDESAFAALANALPFVCGDCARAAEARDVAERAERDRDREQRSFESLVAASGLPEGLRGSRCPGSPQTTAADVWACDGGGLLLTGPVGVGKTTLAAAAAWRVLRAGRPLRWLSAPLLFARLGSGMGTAQREAAVEALTGRRALVLDDIDKARPTEYAAEHVFLAVDTRVTDRTPLLATSNLEIDELAARWPEPYGEAIASRLAGYCRIVRMTGPDRRMAARPAGHELRRLEGDNRA